MSFKKTIKPRVGIAVFSSPLEIGAKRAETAVSSIEKILLEAGCEVVEAASVNSSEKAFAYGQLFSEKHVDAIVAQPVSWFEDYLALDTIEECPVPLLLWPLPGMETGALCGAQQAASFLKHIDHPFFSVFGDSACKNALTKAISFLRAAALNKAMHRSKIGLAGSHVNGMTHTSPNEFMLKKTIGSRVISLDLPGLLQEVEKESQIKAREKWDEIVSRAGFCNVSEADGVYSIKMYYTLKKVIEEKELNALSVGCYPQLMGKVCIAASLLADEGVPMACEGDVNGAVAMLILSILSNGAVHNCDWLEPVGQDTVLFAHCGSGSFSLAEKKEDIKLESVRLMGQGVCAQFPSRPGPVTLLNLTPGENSYLCAVLEGEAVETEMLFPGNPLKVRFKTSPNEINDWIFSNGLGHHWMAAYGHYAQEITHWNKISGKNKLLKEI
jgi:L-fucose isomerase-like protein